MAALLHSSSRLFFKTLIRHDMVTLDRLRRTRQSAEYFQRLTNLQRHHGNSVFYNSQAGKNDDNKAIKKATVMHKSKKHASFAYKESVWESFFATPYKWYDCRTIKRNKRAPDFRHIDTGEGVWIESHKSPAWALYKVNSLGKEFAPAPTMEDLWKNLFVDPSKWFDNRKVKESNKHPDFLNKDTLETLWLDNKKNPAWITPMIHNLQSEAFAITHSSKDLWRTLFADPSKWFDDRKLKKSGKYPDFKCMSTGEALWLDDKRTPTWVAPMLNKLHEAAFATSPSKKDSWKTFFSDPSKWFDDRKIKRSDKHPDFKHKHTRESLWIMDIKAPSWVAPMLNNLKDEAFAASPSIEGLWDSFFSDPSKWFDNRKAKKTNKHPDFTHKDTHEALWITSMTTPSWVVVELSKLGNDAFAPRPRGLTKSSSGKEKQAKFLWHCEILEKTLKGIFMCLERRLSPKVIQNM